MTFDPSPAAAALDRLRAGRAVIDGLPADIAPRDEAQGAAVQRARATDARIGGFKIGASAQRMQALLGLSGPVAGFMAAGDIHPSGAALPFAQFGRPGVECELAVRLARDLPPEPCTPETAREAVAELMAAIEIVDNRYGDLQKLGAPTLIADQVYHAAAVLGAKVDAWPDLEPKTLAGRIEVDGELRGEGLGSELLGDPLAALAWLAGSTVAAAFGGLRAGQVMMLGSVTPPIWLDRPCSVRVSFAGLSPVLLRLM